MEKAIVYHDTAGPENTDRTLDLTVDAALARAIHTIVVASRSGATASALMERLEGTDVRMVAVTPQYGWRDQHEFDRSLIGPLREAGHDFYAGTMPFHTDAFHGCSAPQRMGDVLRIFSQGVQVCVEVAMMAADGGLLRCDRPCLVLAGTGRGVDTAMLVTPSSSAELESFRVHEILCKPHLTSDD
jgi:hypothetical protein